MQPIQLIAQLIAEGGAIVSSGICSVIEIADAQATGRFAVDAEGLGFVRRYKEWVEKARRDHQIIEFVRTEAENHADGSPDATPLERFANQVVGFCAGGGGAERQGEKPYEQSRAASPSEPSSATREVSDGR